MIRQASIQDFDRIMEMMINFADSSPYAPQQDPQYNDMYVRKLLCGIIKQGVILVGEINGKIEGMLIGLIQEDIWLPHIKTMKEIAWWVEPEHRMSSMGYRLLKEYVTVGTRLQDNDIIHGFTLTNMVQSPDFKLEKRGWEKIETNYVYEGV
jgi:hypothetical protein